MIEMEDGEWLIPFVRRNWSGPQNQNFLWRHNNLYVMDNHRAAAWCWLQHIDPDRPHSLLHMDRHSDALRSQLDLCRVHCPADLKGLDIQQYLALDYEMPGGDHRVKLFRWDNYLSIYLDRYGDKVETLRMITHQDGDEPEHRFISGDIWDVPTSMDFWLDPERAPWILNIDVDYFFTHGSNPGLMVSKTYLETCFAPIRKKIDNGEIAVATIALTPHENITGGWAAVESVAKEILGFLDVSFALPVGLRLVR